MNYALLSPAYSAAAAAVPAPLRSLPDPQWIQCDLRTFDLSTLGKFGVVMADPPWDINIDLPYGTMSDLEMRGLALKSLQTDGYIFLWVGLYEKRCTRLTHRPSRCLIGGLVSTLDPDLVSSVCFQTAGSTRAATSGSRAAPWLGTLYELNAVN